MGYYTNLNIKIDNDVKAKADRLFIEMGMDLTTAVNVFVRQQVDLSVSTNSPADSHLKFVTQCYFTMVT